MLELHGHCDERFTALRDVFVDNFERKNELGASVAVMIDGEMVVDLWAGWLDEEKTEPWQEDTIAIVHSVTKGMLAFVVHMLAAREELDFDAEVTEYWPEFGDAGKSGVTLRQLISHQAGLPILDGPLDPGVGYDWEAMVHLLEAQAPIWPPGTKQGYHAATWGHLIGEVVRRVTGRSPGTVLREELCEPWQIDFHLGFGPELDRRIANLVRADDALPERPADAEPGLRERAFGLLPPRPGMSAREQRAAESPSGGGYGNARSVARAFGGFARGGELDGIRLLEESRIPLLYESVASGYDEVLEMPSHYGLGFWLAVPGSPLEHRGRRFLNHPGVGGQIGFADVERKLGFGYVMNRAGATLRRIALERALYRAIA